MSAARHGDARHLLVEKDQRAERLVLRRRGVVALNGEVIEKGQNLGHTELAWVALPVEDHEDADPLDVGLLGVARHVKPADDLADLVEERHGDRVVGDASVGPERRVGRGCRQGAQEVGWRGQGFGGAATRQGGAHNSR